MMSLRNHIRLLSLVLTLGLSTSSLTAGQPVPSALVPYIPPGLGPGDSFHLAFVTSTTTQALDPTPVAYDVLVDAAADGVGVGPSSPGGVDWNPMVATGSAPDAGVTAPISAPIFRFVDGTLLDAQSSNAFYNRGFLDMPISLTELGTSLLEPFVWTGIDPVSHPSPRLGALGNPAEEGSIVGNSSLLGFSSLIDATAAPEAFFHVMGITPMLTVVPEPGAFALMALGLLGLLGFGWRQRRLRKQ